MGKGFGGEFEGYLSPLVKSLEQVIQKGAQKVKYSGNLGKLQGVIDHNFKEESRPTIRFHHKDSVSEYYEVSIPFQLAYKDIQGLNDKFQTALCCEVKIEAINRGYYIIVYPAKEVVWEKK